MRSLRQPTLCLDQRELTTSLSLDNMMAPPLVVLVVKLVVDTRLKAQVIRPADFLWAVVVLG